jgi:hypothetical protein
MEKLIRVQRQDLIEGTKYFLTEDMRISGTFRGREDGGLLFTDTVGVRFVLAEDGYVRFYLRTQTI